MKKKILLSSPHMGGEELSYIQKAFDSNWIAPVGENIKDFEEDIDFFLNNGVKTVALSSGTAALHLALIQCGVSYGDEVICQSMTFSASANPIVYQGAKPIFVDSEPDTWNICPLALENAIKDRIAKGKMPKAIVVVYIYGMPYKVEEIGAIAKKYNIPIIEDASEALGSSYKGVAAGTYGHFGALSFNGNKIITTSGGGALICKNQKDKEQTIFLATQAKDNAPHYQHSQIGYNYRMSNIIAGIGRGQMKVLQDRIDARRKMHQFYVEIFKNIEGVTVFSEPTADYFSNHWLSAITINPFLTGKTKESLSKILIENNIESRSLWKPMHLQPVFANQPYYGTERVSEELFEKGLCLPSGSNLNDDDKNRIKTVLKEFFK